MAAPAIAPSLPRRPPLVAALAALRPTWSRPAAYRAIRAAIVIPGLFALTSRVIGNPQMATFAAFGSFATLVLAGFGGGRRDKLVAHLGLAIAGSLLLVIGTAINSVIAVAALVTLPVAFLVLFGGALSPNAASGATAALLAFVLPAASPGTMSMVPSRLAGWWLASVAGALAVQILYARPPTDRLRAAAGDCAAALAAQLGDFLDGRLSRTGLDAAVTAKQALVQAYREAPYRPSGLALADQAIGSMVEGLQWCTASVCDAFGSSEGQAGFDSTDRVLLARATGALRGTAAVIGGGDAAALDQALSELGAALSDRASLEDGMGGTQEQVHAAFHSRLVAAAARSVALDVLVVARRLRGDVLAEQVRRWRGEVGAIEDHGAPAHAYAAAGRSLFGGHTDLRSVWFLNSARGAVALAAAVAVADITNVQHGFWVVLGTLSVLRTNAASTGATAVRALAGTAVGFVVGAALVLAIGHHPVALWVVLPLSVFVAAYAPGTAPFAVGQAAFTVTISVLYNIIVPIGWKVGELRVEDVAIGVAVSVAVGVLFWPRGATGVVGDDLADAFHEGGLYLVQATAWALGARAQPPDDAASVVAAATRLDGALRAFLAEQGTKRAPKEQLWRLVGGALRLRLTAQSLAGAPAAVAAVDEADARIVVGEAVRVAGLYDRLAAQVGRAPATVAMELANIHLGPGGPPVPEGARSLWAHQHVEHLRRNVEELGPAAELLAAGRARPWWR